MPSAFTITSRHLSTVASRVLAAIVLMTPGVTLATDAPEPPLKAGVGLHGPLTWGRSDPEHKHYIWPVYADSRYDLPIELLGQVKASGFDFIRLTIDPGPFLAAQASQRIELDQRVLNIVSSIRQTGLDVIVDFHPIHMIPAYAADRIVSDATELFPAYVEIIRHTASLLAPQAAHVAIEPFNEPPLGYTALEAARWQSMMKTLYDAVRAESPTMTIIISGGRGGSVEGLLNIDPKDFHDTHVRYSFHYYLPFIFSHQGVANPNSRLWTFTTELPYPAQPEQLGQFWTLVKTRVGSSSLTPKEQADTLASGKIQLEDYFNGKGTQAAIAADFDRVSKWAEGHQLDPNQIFMGEFGVTQKLPGRDAALPEDRARWISDVREEAEKRGFHWSFWSLNQVSASLGMTLVSVKNEKTIDPTTVKALGKQAPSQ